LEFALEIGQSYLDIAQGDLGIQMSKQLHQHGEADAGAWQRAGRL
jgi:hypothetical protein